MERTWWCGEISVITGLIDMIQKERVEQLNKKPVAARKYVLYWMQQSQRSEYNHALEYAIERANELDKPVVVCFGLTDDYPEANERHYYFMLEGLIETERTLADRGIEMIVEHGSPETVATRLAQDACILVTDRGYLRIQRMWRDIAARRAPCLAVQVETDVVVPVNVASTHEEYSAATLRRKIKKNLDKFLIPIRKVRVRKTIPRLRVGSVSESAAERAMKRINIDRSVLRSAHYQGGTGNAKQILRHFIKRNLAHFPDKRNDPSQSIASSMSPYLHFGQISPIYIALQVQNTEDPGTDAFLEELIVRRELSMNFAFYNQQYDSFSGLPAWARQTLQAHRTDPRPYVYDFSELEHAQTHDEYWNAAQKEMTAYGKMHGYMRMYWGKKIIEWTEDPERAFETALHLNNKYEIDGRDANAYAGVAWCFGKHDRPWPERKIFGKVRYMNAAGLRRKFNIKKYVERIPKGE